MSDKIEATRLADALDRMDALLKPALGFLTVPYNSATAQAAVIDMGTIRGALRKQSERIAALEAALAGRARVIEQARGALKASKDREYNPFEPNNQSEHYKRLCAALRAIEEVKR